ncbi:MAG: ZIP family metal transporter [Ruminococcaceae bacterium]|nr:ZIP family metal transporter [Oscillospiraceae bacterium]
MEKALLYALLGCLFTFFMTALGAAVVIIFKENNSVKLKNILYGFASGVMLAAAVWSLLIPSMEYAEDNGVHPALPSAGGFILGVLFILIFDNLINRLSLTKNNRSSALLISAITLHNIPEGMAVGLSFATAAKQNDPALFASAIALAIGIGIQNFPEGAAVALPLRQMGEKRLKAFFLGSMSGIVEPIFGVLTVIIASFIASYIPWFLSFAAGAMFLAVVKELIPAASENCDKKGSTLGSIGASLGFLIMMVLDISL